MPAETPTVGGVGMPLRNSGVAGVLRHCLGAEGTAGHAIGAQHLDAGQDLRLKTHERAAIRHCRDVRDPEEAALPAVGRLFRPRHRAGGGRCMRWHGRAIRLYHHKAGPAPWPCRAWRAHGPRAAAGPGSGHLCSGCRMQEERVGSTCKAWSKRCAMQIDTSP